MKNDKKEKKEEKSFFSQKEEETLKFWKKNKIFEKSIEQRKANKKFIFFEGPPTANGKPGIHHVLARSYKDIICRYKTMRGYRVERKAGWDTHGLPVELQVEKELKISSKPEIEKFGIEEFNKKCKDSVWHYKDEWERLTERMAYWLDLEHPYITYSNEYIESVWWILAEINKKGLLYEGHKVVPYCSRCGTGLSSHEVAQGYKKIKDTSVYVKFKAKAGQKIGDFTTDENTYFLVWTTTPWTLPGNVALAVGKDIDYLRVKTFNDDKRFFEYVILAKDMYDRIGNENKRDMFWYKKLYPIQFASKEPAVLELPEKLKGKDLLNLEYDQLFDFVKPESDKPAFKVVSGDFVTTQDGSGIVHIAPAFGVDDMNVAQENNLPVLTTVNADGKFTDKITPWAGKYVVREETNKEIVNELDKRGILFKTEPVEHDYPFCWRCNTKLIYYAKKSWFIKMTDEKTKGALIKNNSEINWVPEYIKEGRMGEWLREVKDWALSRERYWGTPLPVWKCKKCEEIKVVGSIDEIREPLGNLNKLFLVRHGEAENNALGILNSDINAEYHLTEKGKEQVKIVADILKKEKIDVIISSPFLRTKETAEIIAKELKLGIVTDDRLGEFGQGRFEGKKIEEFKAAFPAWPEDKENKREEYGFETENEAKNRFSSFIEEINNKYKNKNIIIVSHGDPLQFIYSIIEKNDRVKAYRIDWYPKKGSLKILYSKKIDLHKPVIDKVTFKCEKCGGIMEREKDVIDCWFDSGAMPFAQGHWPFAQNQKSSPQSGIPYAGKIKNQKLSSPELFPADYISEAIDQTRGWFYTLLAISTLLDFGAPYKNVITYGHILDDKGQKMSKSKGNVVDPWLVADKYGIDMLRWYFYTIGAPGEPKRFDFKEMEEIRNKFFRAYWNSFVFYETYKNIKAKKSAAVMPNDFDAWIISRLDEIIDLSAKHLENYDVMRAARLIAEFIDELSNKYIRFSRDRMRSGEPGAINTLKEVLIKLTKITAPFVPFISEEIYRNVKEANAPESVHLADWPMLKKYEGKAKEFNKGIAKEMQDVFAIIDLGRTARILSKIPVRQALAAMEIRGLKFENKELEELIKKELNVKKIVFKDKITDKKEFVSATNNNITVALDTVLTEELQEEGLVRELIRQIQDLRKNSKYTIKDLAEMYYNTDSVSVKNVLEAHGDAIKQKTILSAINAVSKIEKEKYDAYKEIKLDGGKVEIGLKLTPNK